MTRRISLEPHLTIDELEGRYRSAKDSVERSRWHFLWLLARGLTAKLVASMTGFSAYWIGRIAQRYNQQGPDGVKDLRRQPRPSSAQLLSVAQRDELAAALAAGAAPEDERWSGRTVAAWISQRLGRCVGRQLGWVVNADVKMALGQIRCHSQAAQHGTTPAAFAHLLAIHLPRSLQWCVLSRCLLLPRRTGLDSAWRR